MNALKAVCGRVWLILAVWSAAAAQETQEVQETEDPGLDFLEYLGSWQEEDEEWLIVAEWDNQQPEQERRKGKRERQEDE